MISLRDRANLLCETIQDMVTPPLSETARNFIRRAEIDSASELLNVSGGVLNYKCRYTKISA